MARLTVARHLDQKRMFAIWRVDPPWQPVTKKGQGQRMGGGKGAIDHYVTPVKAGRIVLEIGGKCEYAEVCNILILSKKFATLCSSALSVKLAVKVNLNGQQFFSLQIKNQSVVFLAYFDLKIGSEVWRFFKIKYLFKTFSF